MKWGCTACLSTVTAVACTKQAQRALQHLLCAAIKVIGSACCVGAVHSQCSLLPQFCFFSVPAVDAWHLDDASPCLPSCPVSCLTGST
jgi:hypothetical protein